MTASDDCKEIFAMLSDYLNLELPPDACKAIETHLEGCSPCVEFAKSLETTVQLCRKFRPSELPEPIGTQARQELVAAYEQYKKAQGKS
jgi:predicted anti-sigma-YlaC factor YlaD